MRDVQFVTDAEVLSVTDGTDLGTGLPIVCLTLRPAAGSGWAAVNYSLSVENARSLLGRLATALQATPGHDTE